MKDCTLHEAAQAYLEHLRGQGKKERTLYTYSRDFDQMETFFGADRKLKTILPPHVGKFLKSDALLKLPKGADRAKPTVDKTIRVFRMFLVWAKETGRIEKLPLPKDFPMGRSTEKETQEDAEPEHNAAE
jgi:site-specific recombinase XerD